MSLPVAILILVLLGLVVLVVSAPLRERGGTAGGPAQGASAPQADTASPAEAIAREDLEAAREAKYREIRDSELDFRTGKLSAEDFAAIDSQLRAEALAILDRLEQLNPRSAGAEPAPEHAEHGNPPEAPPQV
jgi:hypothetical protein